MLGDTQVNAPVRELDDVTFEVGDRGLEDIDGPSVPRSRYDMAFGARNDQLGSNRK